jgi:lauroyl/myristoyl acyltransferase
MHPPAEPGRLAVQSIFWRRRIDWVVQRLPAWLHPPLIWVATSLFFFVASSARETVTHHLSAIFPHASPLTNWLRAFRVFHQFAWTLTDSAVYRLLRKPFRYEVEGMEFLHQIAAGGGAIALTAHMGNYDLGSAVFVEKLHREIRMVRAPEPDSAAAAHITEAITEAGGGGVKVDYNLGGGLLSFDLLKALRGGEIISIQGDRAMGDIAQARVKMFDRVGLLPSGPFVLALTAEVPLFPIFVVRCGYRAYRIIARPPIFCQRSTASREEDISSGMQQWADVLSEMIRTYWQQWHAFTPVFVDEAASGTP